MSNPFKVLGFTPNIVRQLDDQSLAELVKRNYRALSRVTHPDVSTGKGAAFREISVAYQRLTASPEIFAGFKAEYLKPRREALLELTEENQSLGMRLQHVSDQLREYVTMITRKGGVTLPAGLLMQDSLTMIASSELARSYISQEQAKQKATFDLAFEGAELIKTPLRFDRSTSLNCEANYFRADPDFVWARRKAAGTSALCYVRSGKSFKLEFVPIGTVSIVDDESSGGSLKKALAITGNEGFSLARSGYSWEGIHHLLPTLSPEIAPDRYLLGAKYDNEGLRFFLVGKILAQVT